MPPRTTATGAAAPALLATAGAWRDPGGAGAWGTGDASSKGKRSWRAARDPAVLVVTESEAGWPPRDEVTPDAQLLARFEDCMEQAVGHEVGPPAPRASRKRGEVGSDAGVPPPLQALLPGRLAELARVLLEKPRHRMAMLETLREHLPKISWIHVADHRRVSKTEARASKMSAVGEVDVLTTQQSFVEHAQLEQQRPTNEEICRDGIRGLSVKRTLLIPQPLGKSLDPGPGLVSDDGAADEIGPRVAGRVGHELSQPARVRDAVGVGESNVRVGCHAEACVARRRRPFPFLVHHPDT